MFSEKTNEQPAFIASCSPLLQLQLQLPRQNLLCGHLRQHFSNWVHQPDALTLLEEVGLEGVVAGVDDVLCIGLHPVSTVTAHVLGN